MPTPLQSNTRNAYRWALATLATLAAVLATLSFKERRHAETMRQQFERQLAEERTANRTQAERVEALQRALRDVEASRTTTPPPRPEAPPNDLINSSEFRAYCEAQESRSIDQAYALLFRKLKLTPEKAAALREMLVDCRLAPTEIMLRNPAWSSMPYAEQRKAVNVLIDSIYQDVKALIGEDGFTTYKTYADTLVERAKINDLTQGLTYTEHPLSREQTEALIAAWAQEQKAVRAEHGGMIPFNEDPLASVLRMERALRSVAEQLSPGQRDELQRRINLDRDIAEKRAAAGRAASQSR